MDSLAVTAYSIATCLGAGRASFLSALRAQRSGLRPCAFETVKLDTFVGEVPDADRVAVAPELARYDCRNNRLAQLGLNTDGFAHAALAARDKYGADRVGVFLGTSTSGILETEIAYRQRSADGQLPNSFRYREHHNTYSVADYVCQALGLTGPAAVLSAACASSAKVFGSAARAIATDQCDAAVVGGVDSLCLTTLYGFNALGLLSAQPCRPYDQSRSGISIGEAAGFALLEKNTSGKATRLIGVGETSDAHHMSTPHPEGLGAQNAMRHALASAGVSADQVDYINAHGTATKTNDEAEDRAIVAVFGERKPVSSTKGLTGHTLGAAGIVEALVCVLALEEGFTPAGANTAALDPQLRCNYLLRSEPAAPRAAMTNSFGFGGANCSLLFARS